MFSTARARRVAAWLGLVAVLAFALLPTLSRAVPHGSSDGWVEVCTPRGMQWMAVDALADPAAPAPSTVAEPCTLCSLSFGAAAALPAPGRTLALPSRATEAPALFLQAPRTLFAWRSAQPRGPPVLG
jgi:hypothetical protein